jgi:hypothetical protein
MTLNPNFDEFVILEPVVGDLEYLSQQILHIDVWDWDKGIS